jgi:hypothetical protein
MTFPPPSHPLLTPCSPPVLTPPVPSPLLRGGEGNHAGEGWKFAEGRLRPLGAIIGELIDGMIPTDPPAMAAE